MHVYYKPYVSFLVHFTLVAHIIEPIFFGYRANL